MGDRRCIVALLMAALAPMPAWTAEPAGAGSRLSANRGALLFSQPATLTYDTEYPAIGYSGPATRNAVARLQDRLDRRELTLAFKGPRGYLDSLLTALAIDPSSQALVFSRTSFQVSGISAASPRALYFNDDTYVAWVPGGELLEIGAVDAALGPVFYTLPNQPDAALRFDRPLLTCLGCHDSLTLTGGGVPRFILGSGYVGINGEQLTHEGRILTTDRTPLRSRWGGWYVTGRHGDQVHLGNLQVRTARELVNLEAARRGNLDTLEGLFDTRPYLTDKSDIVALLVLQHQVYVQNLLTRANFEVRAALARSGWKAAPDSTALELPTEIRTSVGEDLDALVNALLFVGAASLASPVSGNSGFDAWFQARGPRDARGRSLRQLDLTTRLFTYPLSYLIYSESFDSLPAPARHYVYAKLTAVLEAAGQVGAPAHLGTAERSTLLEILTDTKPEFAQFRAGRPRIRR